MWTMPTHRVEHTSKASLLMHIGSGSKHSIDLPEHLSYSPQPTRVGTSRVASAHPACCGTGTGTQSLSMAQPKGISRQTMTPTVPCPCSTA
jgi:hypothetical protein